MAFLLEARSLKFAYPGQPPVLSGAELALASGERLCLEGANGAGKSTLLQILVGLLVPQAGTVIAFGRERREERDFYEVRRLAGLVFQDPDDQLFCPTVAEDVAFGPLNMGKSRLEAAAIVARVLDELNLTHLSGRVTHKLSGGEKRLVTLAAVLAMEPQVLLLDEPTNALDEPTRERLIGILNALPQAMIIVSHDALFRRAVATRSVRLANGRIESFSGGDHGISAPVRRVIWQSQEPRMSIEKIPVTIITGFLGAGKTSLIRHLIEAPHGRRLAILVNEFGDVGIDGDILKGCSDANCPEDAIVELTNGCLCCTVADEFVPTITALLARPEPPQHILIETSGLALPKPLLKAFDWPDLRTRITVDGVIAIADAEAVADGRFAPDLNAVEAQRGADASVGHDTPLGEVFEDQVACADLVILNKVDLVNAEALARAREIIQAESPRRIPVVEATEGRVDPRIVLGINAAAEQDLDARPSHHENHDAHDHDDFETIDVTLPAHANAEAILAKVEAIARDHGVLRAKGYVAVAEKPMRLLVQGVGTRVRAQFDRAWAPHEDRTSRLVVIGEKGFDHAAVTRLLQEA